MRLRNRTIGEKDLVSGFLAIFLGFLAAHYLWIWCTPLGIAVGWFIGVSYQEIAMAIIEAFEKTEIKFKNRLNRVRGFTERHNLRIRLPISRWITRLEERVSNKLGIWWGRVFQLYQVFLRTGKSIVNFFQPRKNAILRWFKRRLNRQYLFFRIFPFFIFLFLNLAWFIIFFNRFIDHLGKQLDDSAPMFLVWFIAFLILVALVFILPPMIVYSAQRGPEHKIMKRYLKMLEKLVLGGKLRFISGELKQLFSVEFGALGIVLCWAIYVVPYLIVIIPAFFLVMLLKLLLQISIDPKGYLTLVISMIVGITGVVYLREYIFNLTTCLLLGTILGLLNCVLCFLLRKLIYEAITRFKKINEVATSSFEHSLAPVHAYFWSRFEVFIIRYLVK